VVESEGEGPLEHQATALREYDACEAGSRGPLLAVACTTMIRIVLGAALGLQICHRTTGAHEQLRISRFLVVSPSAAFIGT